jgi:hypothetical protein
MFPFPAPREATARNTWAVQFAPLGRGDAGCQTTFHAKVRVSAMRIVVLTSKYQCSNQDHSQAGRTSPSSVTVEAVGKPTLSE